jgi:coenzyme F420-dependent glucose-6-phosphate dehydrogenase
VTCPTIRIHPAIVAQAAATTAAMLPGRFFLGVGTGENLNEHVLGQRWPSTETRREMLEEAVGLMRELWRGDLLSHRGRHYTVENARIYTLPDEPIDVLVAAGGPKAAEVAGRIGDGLISTAPDGALLDAFDVAGGSGKPRYAQLTVCWATSKAAARRTAHEVWPNAALRGPLGQELPLPSHFEAAAAMVTEDDVAEAIVCGPDPAAHIARIDEYLEAGYTRFYVHWVGPDQDGFFRFYEAEILPHYATVASAAGR